ncbi:hypothetical protein LTR53_010971 [Teratosphaeriaceae sp. CCFEE 6253]|nr:hypothetical protein LTR53_010971 [Teratosphaeriaceae sp. CCFEE 6253]
MSIDVMDTLPKRTSRYETRIGGRPVESQGLPQYQTDVQGVGDRPSLQSAHTSQSTLAPSLVRTISGQSQDSHGRVESRGTITGSSRLDNEEKPKRKKTGVLGFLSLKEPSSSAWEEYAKTQKEASALKVGRPGTAVLSGVSSRKLPDTVPATNTKWDGLPNKAKRASTQSRGTNRMSNVSSSTRQTSHSVWSSTSDGSSERSAERRYGSTSRNPTRPESGSTRSSKRGSLQSQASVVENKKNAPPALPRNAIHPALRGSDFRPSNGLSRTEEAVPPTPTKSAIHPALRKSEVTPWDEPPGEPEPSPHAVTVQSSPETFLHPPSPPPTLPESLLATPELELSEILVPNGNITSAEPSPRTPPIRVVIDPIVSRLSEQSTRSEDGRTFWHSDTDNEADGLKRPDSQIVNGPTAISKSIPEEPASPASQALEQDQHSVQSSDEDDEDDEVFLPSLRDVNGRTSPFIFEQPTIYARHQTPRSRQTRTQSTASRTTSVAPGSSSTNAPPPTLPTSPIAAERSPRPPTAATTGSATAAYRKTSLSPIRSNSNAPSLAPSEMSAQWKMSPKERLGLGSKMVRRGGADVLPWEHDEGPANEKVVKRQSGVQEILDATRMKRMSLRFKKAARVNSSSTLRRRRMAPPEVPSTVMAMDEMAPEISRKGTECNTSLALQSPAPHQSRLLRLPPELRNRIYEYVLIVETPISRNLPPRSWWGTEAHILRDFATAVRQPPLTRTCRVMRSETIPIFYGANTFEGPYGARMAWLAAIGVRNHQPRRGVGSHTAKPSGLGPGSCSALLDRARLRYKFERGAIHGTVAVSFK